MESKKINEKLELIQINELEGRFEMKPWIPVEIEYIPCECPE